MTTDGRRARLTLIAVGVIVALGAAIRAFGVAQTSFPLNDGGLFLRMVEDLQGTWPALPETTSYNGIGAPYAYPPLAFYLGAILEPWLGIDILRTLPVVAAVLTIPAFYLLARSILPSTLTAVIATAVFAVMPRTFEWLTMGGGLTRAPGLLLSIVALWLTHRVLLGAGWAWVVAAGIAGGLVALTHPEAALFTAISGLVLSASMARTRATFAKLGVAVAIAAVIVLPWFVTIVGRDGLAAILSAGATQGGPVIGLLALLNFSITGSQLFDVVGLLTAIGILLSVLRQRWLLPVWLALVLVLDARGGATYATIPASMLAGQAFVDLFLRPFWREGAAAEPQSQRRALPRASSAAAILASILVAVAVIDAFGSQVAPFWPGVALGAEQRDAMAAAGSSAPDAEVLVVSGRFWAVDATAEWFPVLAGARSVATVQGHEWLGGPEFMERTRAAEALRDCATGGPDCLETWSDEWGIPYSHVFVPKGPLSGEFGEPDCCEGLRLLLAADARYELILDHAGGELFVKRDG